MVIGFLRHHLLQEAAEWCDAGLVFADPNFGPTSQAARPMPPDAYSCSMRMA